MLSPQELLQTIHEQVSQFIPDAGKAAQEDLSANLKILVSGIISKLDLVSREEFDAQQAVLMRTREKLEQLEKEVADLEARLNAQ
ncbi:MAG: accessory factor UbiK family protein [Oleiphilaceae bacterium]|nr:accessory factor UbiK family protein [Oleiphilaceae bacterium]